MRLIEYFWKDPFNFKVIKQTNSLTEVKQALLDYYLEEVKPEPEDDPYKHERWQKAYKLISEAKTVEELLSKQPEWNFRDDYFFEVIPDKL